MDVFFHGVGAVVDEGKEEKLHVVFLCLEATTTGN